MARQIEVLGYKGLKRSLQGAKRLTEKARIKRFGRGPIKPDDYPAISGNEKTLKYFDCTTRCPRHVMSGESWGNQDGYLERPYPCKYCYVDQGRKGLFAKTICAETEDNTDLVLGVRKKTVRKLNDGGGLRLFSFGDYIDTPGCNAKIENLAQKSGQRGLRLKTITKRASFVHNHADKVDTVNVSVDTIGDGMPWRVARDLVDQYPDKVRIRSVAFNEEDARWWAEQPTCTQVRRGDGKMCVDVITLYHGANIDYERNKDDATWEKEVERRRRDGEIIRDFTEMRPMNAKKLANKIDPGRTCCETGKCYTCQVKCAADTCTPRPIINEKEGHVY